MTKLLFSEKSGSCDKDENREIYYQFGDKPMKPLNERNYRDFLIGRSTGSRRK